MEELLNEAVTFAKAQNKRRVVVLELKKVLYNSIVYTLDERDPPLIESGRFNV